MDRPRSAPGRHGPGPARRGRRLRSSYGPAQPQQRLRRRRLRLPRRRRRPGDRRPRRPRAAAASTTRPRRRRWGWRRGASPTTWPPARALRGGRLLLGVDGAGAPPTLRRRARGGRPRPRARCNAGDRRLRRDARARGPAPRPRARRIPRPLGHARSARRAATTLASSWPRAPVGQLGAHDAGETVASVWVRPGRRPGRRSARRLRDDLPDDPHPRVDRGPGERRRRPRLRPRPRPGRAPRAPHRRARRRDRDPAARRRRLRGLRADGARARRGGAPSSPARRAAARPRSTMRRASVRKGPSAGSDERDRVARVAGGGDARVQGRATRAAAPRGARPGASRRPRRRSSGARPHSHISPLMFSMTPSTRMFDWRAKSPARAATTWAAGEGVVTRSWPVWGRSRASVIAMSPVPGGVSITKYSTPDQSASSMNWATAFWTTRPRQSSARSSSASRPIESRRSAPSPTLRSRGTILPARARTSPSTPRRRVSEKPQTSASSTPTTRPVSARAAARLAATDDLPTPPLPERDRDDRGRDRDRGLGRGGLGQGAGPAHELGPGAVAHHRRDDVDLVDALGGAGGLAHVALDLAAQGAGRRGQGDLDAGAPGLDLDGADHAQVDDGRAQLGVEHVAQARAKVVGGRHGPTLPAGRGAVRAGSAATMGLRVKGGPWPT